MDCVASWNPEGDAPMGGRACGGGEMAASSNDDWELDAPDFLRVVKSDKDNRERERTREKKAKKMSR
jgi:hypothetical protein